MEEFKKITSSEGSESAFKRVSKMSLRNDRTCSNKKEKNKIHDSSNMQSHKSSTITKFKMLTMASNHKLPGKSETSLQKNLAYFAEMEIHLN